jgi:HAD superfamily hydrolase (TIGR01490 family)
MVSHPTAPGPAIAFFDLDKTLLAQNSGSLWIRSELRDGFVSWRQAARGWAWLVGYHLGYTDIQPVLRDAIRTLRDTPEVEIAERTRRFYEREVRGIVRPGAHAALTRHRDVGDRLVLLTTSSNYLSSLVSAQLGLDDYLCNRFEVRPDGRFTGEPDGDLCYGHGKLVKAQAYAGERGVDLRDCAFYTDSVSDLPVLEAVGVPVAVNPDPRLKRLAQSRGWRVEDWGAA